MELREELDFFNINEATLFPELEHQMTYIKRVDTPQIGSVPDFKHFSRAREQIAYDDLTPNIEATIEAIIPQVSTQCKNKLIEILSEQIEFVDWKFKDNIKAKIVKETKRLLQNEHCFKDNTEISEVANRLLDSLLNPSQLQSIQL